MSRIDGRLTNPKQKKLEETYTIELFKGHVIVKSQKTKENEGSKKQPERKEVIHKRILVRFSTAKEARRKCNIFKLLKENNWQARNAQPTKAFKNEDKITFSDEQKVAYHRQTFTFTIKISKACTLRRVKTFP